MTGTATLSSRSQHYDPFRSKSTDVAKRKRSRVSNLGGELKRTHFV